MFGFGNKDGEEKKKSNIPSSTMLTIRAIIGGYLVYLAYDLFTTRDGNISFPLLVLICIVFAVVGGAACIHGVYCLYKGIYDGGKNDPNKEPEIVDVTANDAGYMDVSETEAIVETDAEAETDAVAETGNRPTPKASPDSKFPDIKALMKNVDEGEDE